jgi:hypothetical protein
LPLPTTQSGNASSIARVQEATHTTTGFAAKRHHLCAQLLPVLEPLAALCSASLIVLTVCFTSLLSSAVTACICWSFCARVDTLDTSWFSLSRSCKTQQQHDIPVSIVRLGLVIGQSKLAAAQAVSAQLTNLSCCRFSTVLWEVVYVTILVLRPKAQLQQLLQQ